MVGVRGVTVGAVFKAQVAIVITITKTTIFKANDSNFAIITLVICSA
jgi:hypothetical protein